MHGQAHLYEISVIDSAISEKFMQYQDFLSVLEFLPPFQCDNLIYGERLCGGGHRDRAGASLN
jgi:hypothetical protein